MVNVHMSGRTLLDTIKSAYLAFNKEVLGGLYGKHQGNDYYIESVLNAQKTVNQKPTEIVLSANQLERLETTVVRVEQFLGYFHSHCEYWNNEGPVKALPVPGDLDLEDYLSKEDLLFLLITIDKTNRTMPVCYRNDHSYIAGTFNGTPDRRYHIGVKVYYKVGNRHRIGKLKVSKNSLEKIFL